MNKANIYKNGSRFHWVTEESLQILNRGYLLEGETIEEAVHRIATSAANRLQRPEWASYFEEIIAKGWFSSSSPVYANMGAERALPISCFNVHISDNMMSIKNKIGEVMIQTQMGGGTSGYFGELRHRGAPIKGGGESSGSVSYMRPFDTVAEIIAQGRSRRGAFAAYLDVRHKDIHEFLTIKDIGSPMQTIFFGVCIDDAWMEEMIEGDEEKQSIWAKILDSRQKKGLPYLFFTDNVNNGKPEIYKKLNLQINGSNLCSEIALPSTETESFVCCLGSMNLELYDEWKDTDAVFYATALLDAIMQEFIDKSEGLEGMTNARNFAIRHRAIGLGVLGWHSYLQANMIPMESMEAKMLNVQIFKSLQEQTRNASVYLGNVLGHAPIFDEVEEPIEKMRNTTTMTLPPTTSSAAIMNQTSPTAEPYNANIYKVSLAKGNFMRINKHLRKLLVEKYPEHNNAETWGSIESKQGSVQHLEFLTPLEKDVFKTSKEISQMDLIILAAQRQKFIDQSQSLNMNIPPEVPIWQVSDLYITAWKLGIKTLYYQRSKSVAKDLLANNISVCSSCEG